MSGDPCGRRGMGVWSEGVGATQGGYHNAISDRLNEAIDWQGGGPCFLGVSFSGVGGESVVGAGVARCIGISSYHYTSLLLVILFRF